MRAVGFDATLEDGDGAGYGAGVLRNLDLPVPVPGPGEVLIRVAYAGLDHRGPFAPASGAGLDHRGPSAPASGAGHVRPGRVPGRPGVVVPGREVSGEVQRTGPGVTGLAPGDPVAAYLPGGGGYAQYAVAPAALAFPLDGISLRDGGGAALVLTAAYGLLAGAARLAPGDTVLIHAAAGAIGSAAAQIARALGAASVHGTTASAAEAAHAVTLGYDAVHPADAFADAVAEVDVVLAPAAGYPAGWASALPVLAPFGRLTLHTECAAAPVPDGTDAGTAPGAAAGPDAGPPAGDLGGSLAARNRGVCGYDLADLARRAPERVRAHAMAALALLSSGAIRSAVTAELPLKEALSPAPAAPACGHTLFTLP